MRSGCKIYRQLPRRVAPGLMASILPAIAKCWHDPARPAAGAGDTAKPRSRGKASSRSPDFDSRPSAIEIGRGEPSDVASRQASRRPQPPLVRWGATPRPPREARLPLAGLREAQVGHEVAEGTASSRAAQPKRNERGAIMQRSPCQG